MASPLFPKYVSGFADILWNSAQDYALLCGYKKLTKKLPISELAKIFSAIESVIPDAASAENQLADKAYVDFGVEQMAAKYLAYDAQGNPFPSYAEFAKGKFYYNGVQVQPTKNDYALVNGDEKHNGAITRYWYTGSSWSFQYIVNNTPLNEQQLAALNSAITAAKVTAYDQHIANTNIHTTQQEKESWDAKYSKPSGGIPSSDMTQAVQDALSNGASALQPTGDGKEVTSTVTEQNNYTNPGSNATTLTIIFGKIWNFIGRLVTAWQNTPDDTHFPSEKLVKSSIDNLANTMSNDYCTKNNAQKYANYVAGPGITITGSGLDPKTVSSNLSEAPLVQKTLGVKIIENNDDTASIVTAPDMLLYATNSPFMQSTNGAMYFNVTSGTFETYIPEADSTLEVTNEDVRGFDSTILYKCYMKVKVENTSASDVTITMSVPSFGTNDTSVQHLAHANTTTTMDVIWYSKGRTSFTGTISGLVSDVSAGVVEIHAVEVRYA